MWRGINASEDQSPRDPLAKQVINAEFQTPISMLAQAMTNQANQDVVTPSNMPTLTFRVKDFARMKPF